MPSQRADDGGDNVILLSEKGPPARVVATGGRGPHDPGMEARVAAVETDLKEIKGVLVRLEPLLGRMDDRLRKMETDTLPKLGSELAELKGRVSQLPSTIQLIGFVLAVLAIAGFTRYFVH